MVIRSPIPLYLVIADAVRKRIDSGEYDIGSALPTEAVLAVEFGVSRPTVRQALAELANEGLISRERGRGTFVRPSDHHRVGQRFRGSLQDLIAETQRTGVKDLQIRRGVPIPSRFADLLELERPIGTIVKRTRSWDDKPFAFTVNYLGEEYGRLLTEDDLRSASLMGVLAASGVAFEGARQSVRAQMADPDLTDKLGLPYSGAPVLYVERLVMGVEEQPIELVHTWYRGDAYEYTVSFEFGEALNESPLEGLA